MQRRLRDRTETGKFTPDADGPGGNRRDPGPRMIDGLQRRKR